MSSEPTKEAMVAALKVLRAIFGDAAVLADNEVRISALAIDAHTAALRAENAHLKSVNEKGLAELARLREQVRLAVEARKAYRDAWVRQQSTDCEPIGIVPEVRAPSVGAELADSALRAAGVEF